MKRTGEAKLSQTLLAAASLPVRLHFRNDLHLARKTWHMGMGLFIAFMYNSGVARGTALEILGCFLGVCLLVETARLRVPSFNEAVMRLWGPLMRTNEMDRLSGIPYYLAATILAIGVFPRPIAVLSILYLACGDPIASVFGILYGNKSIRFANGKSLIGTAAGVATCALVTWLFLSATGISGATLAILTLVGGFAGGAAEMLPLEIDDNFSIPFISGFALWLAYILLAV